MQHSRNAGHVKTSIDLPDALLHRARVVAAERRTTLKEMVIAGLKRVTVPVAERVDRDEALDRLRQGFHLGGALSRDEAHARVSPP